MFCGMNRHVNITINGCGPFMPFMGMPIGGFPPMFYGCGWGMSPVDIFGFRTGTALGNMAFRGIASLFNMMA